MKFRDILKFLFTEDEPKPIENIEEKRKAVERFCLAQNHSCGRCNIAMKVDLGDYCAKQGNANYYCALGIFMMTSWVEVIGNIHDNPELLEVDNG